MNKKIESYDDAVEAIYNKKLEVAVDAIFIDLHLLTLNQELLILKKSEAVEDVHMGNVHSIMEEMLDMQDLITDQNNRIDVRKREIEVLEEKGKQIQQRFLAAASDNKFYDFLRRIFKKKYKPPKVKDPNDSESDSDSSSSSSSSDDDEDAGSIDSREVGPIRLDDSICPKGCDQGLYDLTFELRSERHGVELEIKEHNRCIEQTKKDMEQIHKKMKNIEINLKQSQGALEKFQREKQQKLNQVMCTIILKLHQLQHLMTDSSVNNVKDTLIFSKSALSKLYKRVGQLQMETLQQKDKHKLNINHLARMKTDCGHMEARIYNLNNNIDDCMRKKFGKTVDLDEIQEALLKKLIFDLRMSMLDIRSMYEEELHLWRTKYGKKQTELKRSIRDNTARLELLGLLNSEKTQLTRMIQHQQDKRVHLENIVGASAQFKQDICKLKDIVRTQEKELEILNDEIKTLKTKGLQPRPEIKAGYKSEYVEEEEELELMELDEDDDIIEFDYTPADRKVERVSIIPKEKESVIVARDILLEMLEDLNIDKESIQNLDSFISDVLRKDSIAIIIDDLLALLPYEPEDREQNILEVVAEKLYSLKDSHVETHCCSTILNTILDKAVLRLEAVEDIAMLLKDLLEQLPTSYILQKDIIVSIVDKITSTYTDIKKEELVDAVRNLPAGQNEDVETVLQSILERVFGIGIDYLYYIKDV